MTLTKIITRKLEVKVWERGRHKMNLMVIKMVSFRKKGKSTPNGERSFSVNQRMNNETYKSEDFENVEGSKVWSVTGVKFYHN